MKTTALVMTVVLLAGAGAWYWLAGDGTTDEGREPLYWVAPMDPDYRRDQPGQSPMGMDLVPVYEEGQAAGVVAVSPAVVNSLGVRTTSVELGRLDNTLRTVGYVGFNQDRLVHMHPRVEGWVENLAVSTEGEAVTAGELVYTLYSPQLVSAQEEYLVALQRDNQQLLRSVESRLRALKVPESLLQQIRDERQVFQTVDYHAPSDGIIATLGVREGHFVEPGAVLMSIAPLDEVWVEAELFERHAGNVAVGDTAVMTTRSLPGREWQGEVDYLYPVLDPAFRTLRARLRFDNADQALKPNMFADLRIETSPGPEQLLVPNDALISTGDQDRVVLSLGEGRYKSVEVTVGERGRDRTEVLAGLEEGDEIVTAALFLLDSESSIDSDFERMERGGGSEADDSEVDHSGMEH